MCHDLEVRVTSTLVLKQQGFGCFSVCKLMAAWLSSHLSYSGSSHLGYYRAIVSYPQVPCRCKELSIMCFLSFFHCNLLL